MVELRQKVGPNTQSVTFHSFFSRRVHDRDVWCFWIGAHGPKPNRWALFGSDGTRVSISDFYSYMDLSLSWVPFWAPYSTCLPRLHVTTFKHKLYNDMWMKEREEIGYMLILHKFRYNSLIKLRIEMIFIIFI